MLQDQTSPSERYGHNLTVLAAHFPPFAGQEAIITRVFQILSRDKKNNPVLLSNNESMRWEVVAEVTRRMAVGPDPLYKRPVIALDYEALFTNSPDDPFSPGAPAKTLDKPTQPTATGRKKSTRGSTPEDWEWLTPTPDLKRLQAILLETQQTPALLYIDHFHRLVGGESERYPIDALNLLIPALARQQIQLIGTCTLEQYRQHIERIAIIQYRTQPILLPDVWKE